MTAVSIVIPNWNGLSHLPACMRALSEQTFTDFETIVVDNGSSDLSVEYLEREWPNVQVVRLGENRGFPAAVNAGFEKTTGDYIVLLNNDTEARPDWLHNLVSAMDAHPEFAFGSSKLLRADDPGVIDSAGHTYSLWLGAANNLGENGPAGAYEEPAWIFGACAAASIYRRSLVEDIGVYDADFFFTHEDIEFDLRANVAGYRCLLVPSAVVLHKRGASYEVSKELHLVGVRNRIWAAGKTLPPFALLLWVLAKAVRVVWWVPARVLGYKPGRRKAASSAGGDPPTRAPWREVGIADAARSAIAAARALPAKRRSVRHIRRTGTVQLLRILRATREPKPLTDL